MSDAKTISRQTDSASEFFHQRRLAQRLFTAPGLPGLRYDAYCIHVILDALELGPESSGI
jgi:hypothetical protein